MAHADTTPGAMRAVLISTYELGHQPFGVASPAAWLADEGLEVACVDLAVEELDERAVAAADLVAVYLPMHTATRLAAAVLPRVRALNPAAHLCVYGLYAPVNADYLRELGAQSILAGEFEPGLVDLARRLANGGDGGDDAAAPRVDLAKQRFRVPARERLPAPERYAVVLTGDGGERVAGYTEASRGCKHLCRHCPVVPVYGGRFFVVGREVVLEDIRQQVAAGAEHVTFGDPDFFNGPGHALRLVEDLHAEWPWLTYDVTIKVEHLLRHAGDLPRLADTGCLFVTTAVESVDDAVLEKLDKGHTRADFVRVAELAREAGLTLHPTFIPFLPWTTPESYLDLLALLAELGLVDNVAPVQLAIRLLLPRGSRLLELPEMADYLGPFDAEKLSYDWRPADPRADDLQAAAFETVQAGERAGRSRRAIFAELWELAHGFAGRPARPLPPGARGPDRPVPHMSEPWYCCAEPTEEQLAKV